jgi:hypothetical protein
VIRASARDVGAAETASIDRARKKSHGKPVLMRAARLNRLDRRDDYAKKGTTHPQPPQPPAPLHEWFCEARFAASNLAWIASLSKPLS